MSLWGHTAKISVRLQSNENKSYFLKVSQYGSGVCKISSMCL